LEQTRHLILHSGGVIDKSYKSKLKISANLGERLTITIPELEKGMIEVFKEGCALLERTETWLENQKKINALPK
jgi:hypothetical protein